MLHYVEAGFVPNPLRFSEPAYSDVLDGIVVSCVDCAVLCGQKMLLGRRRDEPAKGQLWIPGGRMIPGEDPRATAQRILSKEITLTVPSLEEIFDLNLSISYVWERRHQPPLGHGCHMIGNYYITQASNGFMNALGTQGNASFSEFVWVELADIFGNESLHPAIEQVAKAVYQYYCLNILSA